MTFQVLKQQIKDRNLKPVYLLHGEEAYYIDAIVEEALQTILNESERDFNQTVVYAKDTPPRDVIDLAIRLPMMSAYQLVVVKEAQEYKKEQWNAFSSYFASPNEQTVLLLAYKYKKFDKRLAAYKQLQKTGVVFESLGVKDYQLPAWISQHVREKGYQITDKATALIAEFVGNELKRLVNELEKLFIAVEKGTQIDDKQIEKHIGISKDYNVFELVNALLEKDILRANRIVNYFGKHPKAAHITVVLGSLHTLYQRLFKAHFAGTSDPRQLADQLKIHPYPAKELLTHKRHHPPKIISRNFGILRKYDLLSKGVGHSGTPDAELMRELVYQLLH